MIIYCINGINRKKKYDIERVITVKTHKLEQHE